MSSHRSRWLFGGGTWGGQRITRALHEYTCLRCQSIVHPGEKYVLVVPPLFPRKKYGRLCLKCAGPEAVSLAGEKRYAD
jgi:hypothetical protein